MQLLRKPANIAGIDLSAYLVCRYISPSSGLRFKNLNVTTRSFCMITKGNEHA